MALTLSKCFSALVASGNGNKCNGLKFDLQETLLTKNESEGQYNSYIFKFGSDSNPKLQNDLNTVVGTIVDPYLHDVDPLFFDDFIDDEVEKEKEASEFQLLLEGAMKAGCWNGSVGKS